MITLVVLAGVLALILSACGAERAPTSRRPSPGHRPWPCQRPPRSASPHRRSCPAPRHGRRLATPTATPTNTPTALRPRRRPRRPQPRRRIRCRWSIMRAAELSRQRDRDRTEARGRRELPALRRFVPVRGAEDVRAADRAQRHAARDRLAGDHLQPRLHPARSNTGRPSATSRYVDAFARNGYIVFKPDYRGHDSRKGMRAGGYGSPDYTIDVLNALASLKRYPDADPNRIGMWGHSMGGNITLRSMVTTQGHQGGRDLGRGGGVLSRPDEPVAAAACRPRCRPGAALARRFCRAVRLARVEPGLLGVDLARAAIWPTCRVRCSFTTARPTRACRPNSRKPCISRRRRPSCRSRSSTTSIPATTTTSRRASTPPCSDRSPSSIST